MPNKLLKVRPLGRNVYIKIAEVTAGVLDTSSKQSAVEYGEVLALGDEVTLKLKVGDKVFVKAWAIDIVNHEGNKYMSVCQDTNGILAVVT